MRVPSLLLVLETNGKVCCAAEITGGFIGLIVISQSS